MRKVIVFLGVLVCLGYGGLKYTGNLQQVSAAGYDFLRVVLGDFMPPRSDNKLTTPKNTPTTPARSTAKAQKETNDNAIRVIKTGNNSVILTNLNTGGNTNTVESYGKRVVMYTTTECPYCKTARAWLSANNFAYTECNLSVDRSCMGKFREYGATGVPFLVIYDNKGSTDYMRNGFQPTEFLKLMKG